MTVRHCAGGIKKKEPLEDFLKGPVSRKWQVSTCRGGGSETEWSGYIKKAPCEVYLVGGVNPAATYSPGPVGQVPSAMRGLTSVFGKGTGMTPSR